MAVIRVLIVSDIRLYRDGLATILHGDSRLDVVGIAGDLAEAVRLSNERAADVALVDMALPHSVAAVRDLAATASTLKIVALGVHESEQDLISGAEAGVSGYVPRAASVADLVAVLECVGRGELLCSPSAAATLLRRVAALAAGREDAAPYGMLTPREREIAELLEPGLSNKDIARRLGIEVATVKNHVHNLLEKLHVHRRAQAVARLQGRMLRRATPVP
jgi:DNA-binding NarL/FixJ family response regulator